MSKRNLVFIIGILAAGTAGFGYWRYSKASTEASPCPAGKTYVYRVIGGWERTPASNQLGMCISDEDLKRNMVEKDTWWTRLEKVLHLSLSTEEAYAAGNTYYVAMNGSDSNPGTQSSPFRTIVHGFAVMAGSQNHGAGDTLYIRGGTYDEYIDGNNHAIPSGTSWSAPATIKAYPGETPIIQPTSRPSGGGYIFGLICCSGATPYPIQYIIFDGLVLDGSADTRSINGIEWNGAQHSRFTNGEIRHTGMGMHASGSNGGNINADGIEMLNSKIYDNGTNPPCLDTNNCTSGTGGPGHGLYASVANSLYENLEVYHNGHLGMQIYHEGAHDESNNVVRNSKFYDNGVAYPGGGLYIGSGDNNMAYNNFFYGNNGTGAAAGSGASNTRFYNNTIYNNSQGGFVNNGTAGNLLIMNNIIYSNGNAYGDFADFTGGYTLNHNLIGSDPNFANASGADFHLTPGSPAIDAGASLSEVPCDYDGNGRPTGSAYDIGAYEYGGTPSSECSRGGGGTTPTPTPSGSACTQYTSSSQIPVGFGVPWDVTNPSVMLISAQCTGSTLLLKAGEPNTSKTVYVYKTGYVAPSGGSSWAPVDLFGSQLISQAWYPSSAQGVANIPDQTKATYYVAYTCQWTGSKWLCGCRDSACIQSYWQLQRIQ